MDVIPLRRPDPDTQAVKAELIRVREEQFRQRTWNEVMEHRVAMNARFALAVTWALIGFLMSLGIGVFAFIFIAVSVCYGVSAFLEGKKALDAAKHLKKAG